MKDESEWSSIGVKESVKERLERQKPDGLAWSEFLDGLSRWGQQ